MAQTINYLLFDVLVNDEVFILPDRLIVKGKRGWGVVEYAELHIEVSSVNFIEDTTPPKDAAVIGYTWQYVNKNGLPDKRYKNNRQLPKCNYGTVTFKSATGLNVMLYLSNRQNALNFKIAVGQMNSESKQMRLIVENEMMQSCQKQKQEQVKAEILQPVIQNEAAVEENAKSQSYTHREFDSFILRDADSSERELLQKFWDGLTENSLNQRCSCHRKADGSIEISFKGTNVGSFFLQSGKGWLIYPIGNSGKTKQINGSTEELVPEVSKWIRYIMNYIVEETGKW